MRRIDLHSHTTHSDGTLTPTELVHLAKEVGLEGLAVTDHDTTSSMIEAQAVGKELGIEIFRGCEISTKLPTGTVHVLAYDFDDHDTAFQALLARIRVDRDNRNHAILKRLAGLNMPLTMAEIRVHVHGSIVARPHIAQAMVEKGYCDSIREVFDYWLHDAGKAYVQADTPTPEEAIEAIVGAGGRASIAHPKQMKLGSAGRYRRTFTRFRDAGLAGIEVQHPSHDKTARALYTEIATDLGLVPTGGSDFHGSNKPHIRLGEGDGSIEVTYDTWDRLRAHTRS